MSAKIPLSPNPMIPKLLAMSVVAPDVLAVVPLVAPDDEPNVHVSMDVGSMFNPLSTIVAVKL